jgi:hypothetical protein
LSAQLATLATDLTTLSGYLVTLGVDITDLNNAIQNINAIALALQSVVVPTDLVGVVDPLPTLTGQVLEP